MSKICDSVREAVLPRLNEMKVEIVDLTYDKGRRGQGAQLTLFIYSDEGVNLELLETVHRAIDPILDEIDPTGGEPYTLNVSSPGLDRAFVTPRDFERNYGKEVEVSLYSKLDGQKRFEGVLIKKAEDDLVIDIKGEVVTFKMELVSKVNLAIKFE